MTPEQVQKKISEGEVIGVGDTVKIATSNGEVYNFKVTAVTNQQILGDEFSAGKTAALAGGTVLLWAIIVAVALGGTLAL
jgi:hypothetical protein